jgi:hypothetical protein
MMSKELRLGLLVAFVAMMAAVQLPAPRGYVAAGLAVVAGLGFIAWGRWQRRDGSDDGSPPDP